MKINSRTEMQIAPQHPQDNHWRIEGGGQGGLGPPPPKIG